VTAGFCLATVVTVDQVHPALMAGVVGQRACSVGAVTAGPAGQRPLPAGRAVTAEQAELAGFWAATAGPGVPAELEGPVQLGRPEVLAGLVAPEVRIGSYLWALAVPEASVVGAVRAGQALWVARAAVTAVRVHPVVPGGSEGSAERTTRCCSGTAVTAVSAASAAQGDSAGPVAAVRVLGSTEGQAVTAALAVPPGLAEPGVPRGF